MGTDTTWTKALVTGASSGIGEAIARRLAAAGTQLVVVARSEDRLRALADELAASDVTVVAADLATAADVDRVAALIGAGDIDLVVNNAGIGITADVADVDEDRLLAMIDLNVRCLTVLSQAAAKTMKPKGRGGICNISSVAGYVPATGMAGYAASKAYVSSFTQALHGELSPSGVHVTCVAPGFTRTEFQDRADYDATRLPGFLWQSADEVAGIALDAVAANKAMVVPGIHNKVATAMMKPLPSGLARRLAGAF